MYKLLKLNIFTGKQDQVLRLLDNASIPFDPDNTDYQAYLKHIAEGGEVLPADNE
jgi:hypothetical protein